MPGGGLRHRDADHVSKTGVLKVRDGSFASFDPLAVTSGLPQSPDIARAVRLVRSVPQAEVLGSPCRR